MKRVSENADTFLILLKLKVQCHSRDCQSIFVDVNFRPVIPLSLDLGIKSICLSGVLKSGVDLWSCTYTYELEQYSASFLSAAPAKNLSLCEIYVKLSVHKRKNPANRESHAFRKPEKLNITRFPLKIKT